MINLSDEIQEFNNLLLSVSWDYVEFESLEFQEGLSFSGQILSCNHKRLLNQLVKLVPEWERVIGRRQHKAHSYCLDIHIIQVVNKIMKQCEFKKLNNYYKLVILWGALLHDIEKNENVVDPDHPSKSADKANLILKRLNFDEYFIRCVCTLIRYHTVIGFIATDRLNLNIADLTNKIGDEKIVDLFIIFSIADIKAVKSNESFYNEAIDSKIKQIQTEINNYYRKITEL